MEIEMKKTLLAISITSQLFMPATGQTLAPNGTWDTALVLSGTINLVEPEWEYSIPSEVPESLTLFAIEEEDGNTDGEYTTWDGLLTSPLTVMKGKMIAVSRKIRSGLFPTIVLTTPEGAIQGDTKIEVPIYFVDSETQTKEATSSGYLEIEVESKLAIAFTTKDDQNSITTSYDIQQAKKDFSSLPAYSNYYTSVDEHETPPQKNAFPVIKALMQDQTTKDFIAINDLVFKTVTLVAKTKALTDNWAATLPITVTLQ